MAVAATGFINDSGLIYVYETSPNGPPQPLVTLPSPGGANFGESMSIYSSILVVGSSDEHRVYVYDLESSDPEVPIQVFNYRRPSQFGGLFGASVSVFENIIAVGAPIDQSGGAVFVFDLSSGTPRIPIAVIENPAASFGGFGESVSLQGNLLAIGAPIADNHRGTAYVYDINDPNSPALTLLGFCCNNSRFGSSVVLNGDRLLVRELATIASKVYLYDITSGQLIERFVDPAPFGDFGFSLAVEGNKVYIGDPRDDVENGGQNLEEAGVVYVYDLDAKNPADPVNTITKPNPDPGENFGSAISFVGNSVAVGCMGEDSVTYNSGSILVFGEQLTLPVESFQVNRGQYRSGTLSDLQASDNHDLSVISDPASTNSVVEIEFQTHTDLSTIERLEFTVEAGVFVRGNVTQVVGLFDFVESEYVEVDSRIVCQADQVTTVSIGSDPQKFVDTLTGAMNARVRYTGNNRRQSFAANVDHVIWVLE